MIGRAAREATTRERLVEHAPRPDGFDPVAELGAQSADRVPDLVRLRNARMANDPLTFLRGAALLQALDLARGPSSGLEVQLCGDAHLMNFGTFLSPEGRSVFDVNDFDETAPGPFEWDVKRLTSSLALAVRARGGSSQRAERIARDAARTYRRSMRAFARQGAMEIWWSRLDLDDVDEDLRGRFRDLTTGEVERVARRARGRRSHQVYSRLIRYEDGRPLLRSAPPTQVPLAELDAGHEHADTRSHLGRIVEAYASSLAFEHRRLLAQFAPVDAARKVVGVGSVGTRCYVILLVGRDVDDPFLLQVKEAGTSVLDQALGRRSEVSPGERVVRGQRLLQATPDELLGFHELTWPDGAHRHFYVRQYYDRKAAVDLESLSPGLLDDYGRVCAWTLARAHARSGLAGEIAGYLGGANVFEEAISAYAVAYADQSERDHAALRTAIDAGRVATGP